MAWKRKTLAAKSGMSAGWAISGAPSPIEQEIGAIAPSIALVHYGANDMQLGTTYQSAIWGFGDNLLDLVDILIDVGVIPIVHGIGMRTDAPTAYRWIDSYNAVIRGVAQARQVPYVNLGLALEDLPGFGLAGDGLHLNTWIGPDGANACVFTPEALQQGFNMRNLQAVSALDVLRRTLHEEPPIEAPVVTQGAGGPDSPFVIDSLPFTDLRDTTMSAFSNLSAYSGCDADQDESGSEYLYVLELSEETRIRAMVFDRGAVDIDIHLLDETASEAGCLQRDHRIVQTTLPAGTYHFALDTFVNSGGTPLGGEFLFVVLRCEDDDPACDG